MNSSNHYSNLPQPIDRPPTQPSANAEMATILSRLDRLQAQIDRLGQLVDLSHVIVPLEPTMPRNANPYSPTVQVAIKILQCFFILLIGFAIALVLAACLEQPKIVEALSGLAFNWAAPLVALVICAFAIAAVAESMK